MTDERAINEGVQRLHSLQAGVLPTRPLPGPEEILRENYQVSYLAREIVVPSLQSVLNCRHLRHHRVITLAEAREMQKRLAKRPRDRQMNTVDVRDTREEYVVNHPRREANSHEARFLPGIPRPEFSEEISIDADNPDFLSLEGVMEIVSDTSGDMFQVNCPSDSSQLERIDTLENRTIEEGGRKRGTCRCRRARLGGHSCGTAGSS